MLSLLFADGNTFKFLAAVDAAITLAAAVAALTPTDKDDRVVDRVKNVFATLRGLRAVR